MLVKESLVVYSILEGGGGKTVKWFKQKEGRDKENEVTWRGEGGSTGSSDSAVTDTTNTVGLSSSTMSLSRLPENCWMLCRSFASLALAQEHSCLVKGLLPSQRCSAVSLPVSDISETVRQCEVSSWCLCTYVIQSGTLPMAVLIS